MGHWQLETGSGRAADQTQWVWEDGDAPKAGIGKYSYDALTDPNQTPPNYKPPGAVVPADVNIPTLTFDAGWLPDITGDLPTDDSNPPSPTPKGDHPPPSVGPFVVSLSNIRETEVWIKGAVGDAVDGPDGYRDLKAYVDRVKHWIFYRPEHIDLTGRPQIIQDAYPTDDSRHAPPSQNAKDMETLLDNLLAGGASSLMTAGGLLEHINGAAQMYAMADKQSVFPTA